MDSLKESIVYLGNALSRLKEALEKPIDEERHIIDSSIQRFEFSTELLWKTLKKAILLEGVEVNSPKETLKKAFEFKWIDDEVLWLDLLQCRNLTSHTYRQDIADLVYSKIKLFFPEMFRLLKFLETKFSD